MSDYSGSDGKTSLEGSNEISQGTNKQLLYIDPRPDAPFLVNDIKGQKPKIEKIERSSIFDRVRAFIPEIKKANEEVAQVIQQNGQESVDVEKVDEEEPYIEMNIGLVEEDSDDSDDSDDSSDNDMMVVDSVGKDLLGDSEGPAEPTSQKLRTGQPNRRKPKIEEVRR